MYRKQHSPSLTMNPSFPGRSRWLLAATACVLGLAGSVQAALPEGLAAYYRFNSTAGLTAVDETGRHNGTLTGALNWVAGYEGNALQFRGGNGSPFVNLGAWETPGPAGLSLACWVKWAGTNTFYQGLMTQRDGTMYWWSELSPDGVQLRFKSNTSPQSNLYLTAPHLVQGEWVHVAFSHDAATKQGTIYLNGESKLKGSWSLPTGTFSQLRVGLGVVNVADGLGTFNGAMDEAMIFQVSLSAADVQTAMRGYAEPVATGANPADGQNDVPRDVMLSWTPAETAAAHDVYFGTSADAVGAADRVNTMDVLAGLAQDANFYAPALPLDFGQTYYWRIDEVNAPPQTAVYKGRVWQFTVEPYGYLVRPVAATASSAQGSMGPEKTIDGSGMTGDQHGTDSNTMWMSTGTQPNWIQYEFDSVYKLHELKVWNSNQSIEGIFGLGAKDVTIEYSADGMTWATLDNVPPFAQAPGVAGYTANTTVNLGGILAKYVKLTIHTSWGTMSSSAGLSEVRFSYIPVQARAPQPADTATGVGLEADLSWRPGREAASHTVYFGTDPNAVAQNAVAFQTVTAHTFDPGSLTYGTKYYWKVDEVNAVTYPGSLWSFTTREFAALDDFESYNDDDHRIFDTWIDNYGDSSGSTVGNDVAPFAEQTIVHGGKQSMPLAYSNSGPEHFVSETYREFSSSEQDWTRNGATHLALWYRGYPAVAGVAVTETGGKMSLAGDGADIWGNSDEFVYACKTLTGDGSIVARVVSTGTGSNTWAKGGVMIRDSLNGGSTFADAFLSGGGGNGASFQYRLAADGGCGNTDAATTVTAPYWVKIERKGDSISGYLSADGKTWASLGNPQTIAMTAPVYIGLCVTSHAPGEQRTFEFDNIATTGSVSGDWQGAQINNPRYNDAAGLYVIVKDTSGKSKLVAHPDPAAAATGAWTRWTIPLSDFTAAGVKMTRVEKLTIGVGDADNPQPGARGMLYLDDIGFGHPAQ